LYKVHNVGAKHVSFPTPLCPLWLIFLNKKSCPLSQPNPHRFECLISHHYKISCRGGLARRAVFNSSKPRPHGSAPDKKMYCRGDWLIALFVYSVQTSSISQILIMKLICNQCSVSAKHVSPSHILHINIPRVLCVKFPSCPLWFIFLPQRIQIKTNKRQKNRAGGAFYPIPALCSSHTSSYDNSTFSDFASYPFHSSGR